MPMISSVQHPDNRALNWGSQQWTNLNSSLQADSKDQWSLVKTVGALFLCVLGAWILSRMFSGSHTVTTRSSVSSHDDCRSTSVTVKNGRIEFSNGPSSLPRITDAGVLKEERRKIAVFEAIQLDIPGVFTIKRGMRAEISLSADQNIFAKLQAIVSASKLTIQAQPNTSFVTNHPIEYTIIVPADISLKEIKVSTAAQVIITRLDQEEFRCTIENAGKVVVQGGQVQKQEITVSGAGSYDARSILTHHSIVVIKDVGDAHVKALDVLDVNIPVAGTCTYYGKEPRSIQKNVSLTGQLVFQMDIAEA